MKLSTSSLVIALAFIVSLAGVQRFQAQQAQQRQLRIGKWTLTFTPDGKAYPIVAAMPNGADTVEVKNVDPKTIETTFKKDGKVNVADFTIKVD